jgi:hypothetical protein
MKTRGSRTGASAKTWLIDQLPSTMDAAPAPPAPDPSAEAMTSK